VALVRVLLEEREQITTVKIDSLRCAVITERKEILRILAAHIQGTKSGSMMGTVLKPAVHCNHEDMVHMILEGRSRWRINDTQFKTAFDIAVKGGNAAIVEEFLESGFEMKDIASGLGTAVERGHLDVAKRLVDAVDKPELSGSEGGNLIHRAIRKSGVIPTWTLSSFRSASVSMSMRRIAEVRRL